MTKYLKSKNKKERKKREKYEDENLKLFIYETSTGNNRVIEKKGHRYIILIYLIFLFMGFDLRIKKKFFFCVVETVCVSFLELKTFRRYLSIILFRYKISLYYAMTFDLTTFNISCSHVFKLYSFNEGRGLEGGYSCFIFYRIDLLKEHYKERVGALLISGNFPRLNFHQ